MIAKSINISWVLWSYPSHRDTLSRGAVNANCQVNSSDVLNMVIHDVLFSEGDRHTGNIHIDENARLRFIDNDNALGHTFGHALGGRVKGLDSVFVPNTARSAILHENRANKPLGLLDYRCLVPGGKMGTNYPANIQRCMREFADSTPEELRQKYLIPRHDQVCLCRVSFTSN